MRTLLIVLLTLLSHATCYVAHARLLLVADGKPRAVILTAAEPSASAKHAAEELQHFLELMSGAKLPIQTDATPQPKDAALLLVGRSKLTSGVNIPSGTDRDFNKEGFVLKTRGNSLILAGNEDGDYNGKSTEPSTRCMSYWSVWVAAGIFPVNTGRSYQSSQQSKFPIWMLPSGLPLQCVISGHPWWLTSRET